MKLIFLTLLVFSSLFKLNSEESEAGNKYHEAMKKYYLVVGRQLVKSPKIESTIYNDAKEWFISSNNDLKLEPLESQLAEFKSNVSIESVRRYEGDISVDEYNKYAENIIREDNYKRSIFNKYGGMWYAQQNVQFPADASFMMVLDYISKNNVKLKLGELEKITIDYKFNVVCAIPLIDESGIVVPKPLWEK